MTRDFAGLRLLTAFVASALLAAACGSSSTPAPTTPTPARPAPAPSPAPPQGSCPSFATSVAYVATDDLVCVRVLASNVSIDCNHHAITDHIEYLSGVGDVSLTNCAFRGTTLQGVANWTIANSTITGNLSVQRSRGMVVRGNTVTNPDSSTSACCLVYFSGGGNNQILNNTIDGGYAGQCSECGADDGILLSNEDGDAIQGNQISNVYDAAIESVNALTNTVIADNRIVNALFTGIGAYWCTHWQGNTVSGNDVSQSRRALFMNDSVGAHCDSPAPSALFTDNTIAFNRLHDAVSSSDSIGLVLQFVINTPAVSRNVLRGNDVGPLGIYATPIPAFMDGGGNVCASNGTFPC